MLNLYGNDIENLNGIGSFRDLPLEDINLGCNKISFLPLEVIVDYLLIDELKISG
jgi:hypothetical protein